MENRGLAHHRGGPFITTGLIDLSLVAAKAIESIGPVVVPVRGSNFRSRSPLGDFLLSGGSVQKGNAEIDYGARLDNCIRPRRLHAVAWKEATFFKSRAPRCKVSGGGSQKVRRRMQAQECFQHHGDPSWMKHPRGDTSGRRRLFFWHIAAKQIPPELVTKMRDVFRLKI